MILFVCLLIHLLSILVSRPNVLGCGLVGFSGSQPPNKATLALLAYANETRGKHSCGIASNGTIEWGTGKLALITDFLKEYTYDHKLNNAVLIHTRHATVGGLTHAHPFGFRKNVNKNKIIVNDPNRPYEMVGMHNGTIENWKDLKEEFELDKWADMDSKTLLGAMFKTKNASVLSKYKGAAAIMMYNNVTGSFYVYKGESALKKPERTLFYIEEPEGVYFSSVDTPLALINKDVKEVPGNQLHTLKEGKWISSEKIKRAESVKVAKVIHPNNFSIVKDEDIDSAKYIKDILYTFRGRYYVNGARLHGIHHFNTDLKHQSAGGVGPKYFVDGILLPDWATYNEWKDKFETAFKGGKTVDFKELSKGSTHPIFIEKGDISACIYSNIGGNAVLYKGKIYDNHYVLPITMEDVFIDNDGYPCLSDDYIEEFKTGLDQICEEYMILANIFPEVEFYLKNEEIESFKVLGNVLKKLVLV